jgi:hypothetical protein
MRAIKILIILLLIGFNVSCSSTYDVKHDYDKQVDFSNLKTFDWMQVPKQAGIDTLTLQRLKNAVNADLNAKGFMMTSDNPDFLIAEHIGKRDQVQVSDWGYGYGGHRGYRGGYWGPSGASTYKYEEGSLILDFVDPKTKDLMWRGSAKAEVQNIDTPEKSEQLINAAVNDILKNFPPSPSN